MQGNIGSQVNFNIKSNNLNTNNSSAFVNNIKENKNLNNNRYISKTNCGINKIELKHFISNKAYFSPKAKTHRKNKLFLNSQKSNKKIEIHLSDNKFNFNMKEQRNKNEKNKLKIENKNLQKNFNQKRIDNKNKNLNNEKSKLSNLLKEEGIKELDSEDEENLSINNNLLNNNSNLDLCTMNNRTYEKENLNFINEIQNGKDFSINIKDNKKSKEKEEVDFSKEKLNSDLLKYSKKGDKEKILELISNPNIDINYKNEEGWTALHFSCEEGNLKISEILIKSNININSQNNERKTPLHISAFNGFFDISKLLVENGANLNILDNENNLAIHLCAENGHSELLAYLLDKNLENIFKKNKYGKTVNDLSKDYNTKLVINEYTKVFKNIMNKNNRKKNYKHKENKKKYFCSKIIIHKMNQNQIKPLITPIHNFRDYFIKNKKNNFYHKNGTHTKKENKNLIYNYNDINEKNICNNIYKYNNNENINNSTSLLNNKKKSSGCFNISINTHKSNNTNSNINKTANNINNNISNTSFKKEKYIFSKNIKYFNIQKLKTIKNNDISTHIKSKTNIRSDSNKNNIYCTPLNLDKMNSVFLQKTAKIGRYTKNGNIKNIQNNNIILAKSKIKFDKKSPGKLYISNTNKKDMKNNKINLHKKIKTILEKRKNSQVKLSKTKRTVSSPGFLSTKNIHKYNLNNSKVKDKIKKNNSINKTSINKIKDNNIINISNDGNGKNSLKLEKIITDEEDNLIEDLDEEAEEIIVNLKEKKKLKLNEHNNDNKNNNKDNNKEKLNKSNIIENKTKLKKNDFKKNQRYRNIINNNINLFTKKNKNNSNYNDNINMNNSNITNQNGNSINANTKDSNINNPTTTNSNTYNNEEDEINKDYKTYNNNIIKKVGPEDFLCIGLLGQGSFGEVYLVNKKNSDEYYAMKVLDKRKIAQQNIFKYAMTERNVLSIINFPFIVKLNYAFQTNQKLFLLLDFAPGGDLAAQLRLRRRFGEEIAKFYICEIALALGELHKHDIIFRDLKPDNIVIDKYGHILLTDFGLSRSGVSERQEAKSFCGSVAYLAPEMLNRKGHGKAVDWYLLGVVFFEMLVGIPPYFSNSKEQIFNNIDKAELILPNFISKKAQELIKALLVKNPDERLGSKYDIEEIKNHSYFKDVDWNKVLNKEYIPPPIVRDINKIKFLGYPKYYIDYNYNDESDDYFNNEFNNYKNERENVFINDNIYEGWSFVQNYK